MGSPIIRDVEDFVNVHGVLLASAGLPPSLYEQLFHKLKAEVLDGGSFFHIEICENGRQRRLVLSSDATLPKFSQVFLVDHAWSFRLSDARKQLQDNPSLVQRLGAMMSVCDDDNEDDSLSLNGACIGVSCIAEDIISKAKQQAKENGEEVCWLEFDAAGIDDDKFLSLQLPTQFPNLVGLSLWGNKLESKDVVLDTVAQLRGLKALWMNGNPVDVKGGNSFVDAVLSALPQLEIYNSKFTKNYGKWSVCFASGITSKRPHLHGDLQRVTLLDLSNRNIRSLHSEILNPIEMPFLISLNLKGNPLDSDTRFNTLDILRNFPHLQLVEVDIPGPLGRSGIEIIENLPGISKLNGVNVAEFLEDSDLVKVGNLEPRLPDWSPKEPLLERVLREMWAYLMTYRLCDEEKLDESPIWYVMDELGSALRHNDSPNFRVAPFMFMPDGTLNSAISYSLLWPIKDVAGEEECTRDFLFGIDEKKQRSARLTAWFHTPKPYFEKVFQDFQMKLVKANVVLDFCSSKPTESIYVGDGHPFAVYTDISQVVETLTRPEFTFCDDPSQADILWTSTQIDDELKKTFNLRDDQYVNQFPFEACIVMKHHLAQTIQQAFGAPQWMQATYNMETQLEALIGDFFLREKEDKNNIWIVKPWNMARTIDTSITNHLPALIHMVETGPKICQKYVEHPALFGGKKFDLRYIVLLRSVRPFELFLSDVFWARISNNLYTLDESSFSDYETHFTVMNYGRKLVHVNTHDFVRDFEEEHKVSWKDIHGRIGKMIRLVFEGAVSLNPEMQYSRSRAIYGLDVLLDSSFEPKLLEVTYCPDCTRACTYDMKNVIGSGDLIIAKEFFNDVFGCLFLNSCRNVTPL